MRKALPPSLLALLAASCSSSSTTTTDSGTSDVARDVTPDAVSGCEGENAPTVSLAPSTVYLSVGGTGAITVRLSRDRCSALTLPVTSSAPSVLTASSPSITFAPTRGVGTLTLMGVSAGTATLTVGTATLTVNVLASALPDCPTTTASAMGRLAPGSTVRGTAGTPLAQASVSLPMAAQEVTARDVQIACATATVPDGYTAVSPAVRFSPDTTRLAREIPFTLPINAARVPTQRELDVEVTYTGPGISTRRVPVADVHFTPDGTALTFRAPRFGTYQAVVKSDLNTRRVRRRFTYHAILGASMGAAGAAMIGMRHNDKFDFIVPLGGPVDWGYMAGYIERYHTAGFCTAAQRAMDPMGCAGPATTERTPTQVELFERRQDFEHWYFPDGYGGQGGTFDRHSYLQIFRDLSRMFGNPVVPTGMTGVLPVGVPDAELTRSDADRCRTPVVLGGPTAAPGDRFYDDEYNPDGSLPVITFCDGTGLRDHRAWWDGTAGDFPMEVALAVDLNGNRRRDPGEPVIRDFHEPYRDTGPDGVLSAMEPGYNADTNPDPAGDDYDRQYNPNGTEGNRAHDEGEPYDDVGLDGIACPAGVTCRFDVGEGNRRYDQTAGLNRFQEVDPRRLVTAATTDALHRVDFWIDGGVRDLFNFGAAADHLAGAFAGRGEPVHYFNNFAPLGAERVPEDPFPYSDLDWAHTPSRVVVRYGSLDATMAQLIDGDGGHVGTGLQITNRLFSSLWWIQARWPGGDRSIQMFSSETDNAGRCSTGYFCTFDYTSERAHRTGPVSIYLPPGYHDPANASVRYPVVFFLHGYGQQPQDLVASGIVIGNFMSSSSLPEWRRPQKYIMVFPDGRCRPQDHCLRGTFYADSPVGNAQMESYFMDLYDFIDATYRTRRPEELDVTE